MNSETFECSFCKESFVGFGNNLSLLKNMKNGVVENAMAILFYLQEESILRKIQAVERRVK